ncbi:MAG: VUT family protein, partial [Alphaproteobacteria bacterium]
EDCRCSLAAYLAGQTLDIFVFHHLRQGQWWKAPLISSILAASLDSFLFFALAFAGTEVEWVGLCAGDTAVKLVIVLFGLTIYCKVAQRMSPSLGEGEMEGTERV